MYVEVCKNTQGNSLLRLKFITVAVGDSRDGLH